MAQPFDAGKLKLTGEPAPVAENVGSAAGYFSVSPAGVLAYRTNPAGGENSSLSWFDREGKAMGTAGDPEAYGELAVSPDGSQIAAFRGDSIGEDLWLIDAARGSGARLTTDPANESYPVWSPDGKQIAFTRISTAAGTSAYSLYRKPAGVSGAEELLLRSVGRIGSLDWSRDGRFLLYAGVQERA